MPIAFGQKRVRHAAAAVNPRYVCRPSRISVTVRPGAGTSREARARTSVTTDTLLPAFSMCCYVRIRYLARTQHVGKQPHPARKTTSRNICATDREGHRYRSGEEQTFGQARAACGLRRLDNGAIVHVWTRPSLDVSFLVWRVASWFGSLRGCPGGGVRLN
jgi:hypothetical protein